MLSFADLFLRLQDLDESESIEAKRGLRRLREAGLLEAKGKGSGTYYVPTTMLLESSGSLSEGAAPLTEGVDGLTDGVPALSEGVPVGLSEGVLSLSEGVEVDVATLSPSYSEAWGPTTERIRQLPGNLRRLPSELLSRVEGLGRRANPTQVRSTILVLCAWRPMSGEQISRILGRDQRYITEKYLGPMIEQHELEYTIPDIPFHMNQAYKNPKSGLRETDKR
jgi:ATP-dependent DNA helicase RecG